MLIQLSISAVLRTYDIKSQPIIQASYKSRTWYSCRCATSTAALGETRGGMARAWLACVALSREEMMVSISRSRRWGEMWSSLALRATTSLRLPSSHAGVALRNMPGWDKPPLHVLIAEDRFSASACCQACMRCVDMGRACGVHAQSVLMENPPLQLLLMSS